MLQIILQQIFTDVSFVLFYSNKDNKLQLTSVHRVLQEHNMYFILAVKSLHVIEREGGRECHCSNFVDTALSVYA